MGKKSRSWIPLRGGILRSGKNFLPLTAYGQRDNAPGSSASLEPKFRCGEIRVFCEDINTCTGIKRTGLNLQRAPDGVLKARRQASRRRFRGLRSMGKHTA